MRLLLLTDGFLPYVIQLANALSLRNEVALLIGGSDPASPTMGPSERARDLDLVADFLSDQVRVTWLTYPARRDPRSLLAVRRAITCIKDWDPEAVHVQESFDYRTLMTVWGVRASYPVVLTIHDVRIHSGEEHKYKRYSRWVRNRLRHAADDLIVHGERLKQFLVDDLAIDVQHVHVCPLGEFSPLRRWAKPGVVEEDHLILFFGRIWPYKGLEQLIQAEPMITKEIPDVKIIIAGQGEDFRRYEKLMVNRDRFVVLNRMIPNQLAAELFQKTSLVALPYTEASQSGVVTIAYSFGKPVVATSVGSIPEIVEDGETGYVVRPRDPKALAEAIVRLLRNRPLRKRMGHKAQRKATNELSWPEIAQKTLRIYRRAVETRASISSDPSI